jgi:hypothetical protein
MTDQRIATWTDWITGTINNNVLTMHLQRATWREVVEILQANGQLPDSYWWEFMRDTYATTQASAVRRQADTRRNVASLGKLIQGISVRPSLITREFWIGLWNDPDKYMLLLAERGWKDQYGGELGDHLDPSIPKADLETLTGAAANVKKYVDEHVAHAARFPAGVTVTLDEVDAAIDVIGHLFKKYYNLFTAISYTQLEPVMQSDWKAVFRQPWMRA